MNSDNVFKGLCSILRLSPESWGGHVCVFAEGARVSWGEVSSEQVVGPVVIEWTERGRTIGRSCYDDAVNVTRETVRAGLTEIFGITDAHIEGEPVGDGEATYYFTLDLTF